MPPTTSTAADEAIARYGVLEEPGARDLVALTELAALVCDVPHAAINLITRDHQHQIAAAGIDPSVCSREDSMCAVVLDEPGIVVSPDARVDPRFATNPFVSGAIDTVLSVCACTSSWGMTVSQPAGIMAPVMIRTHSPASTVPA